LEQLMETRANYVLIGAFTLAVVLGVFGFVYWFQNIGGTGERVFYRVQFEGSVSGLRTGASVLFNGIKIGEVTELKLDPHRPKQVTAGISIDKFVAIRADTEISLEFQGLTGISALSLKGGDPAKPPLVGAKTAKDEQPIMVAPPGATQDVTAAARDALRKVQELIEENQKAIKSALANIEKFTETLTRNSDHIDSTLASIDKFAGALGRNSERVDKIIAGLQNLSGGEDGKSGDVAEAARSIRALADNLDKRTDELTKYIGALARTGTRTLTTIDKAAKNFDANPSRLIWGGSSPDEKEKEKASASAPAATKRR
jgi:phospholipid/cholesterol/gamma-HCH transport system substrate-binding protein